MKNRIFKNMEWWILIAAILLSIIGFFALYSASQAVELEYLKRQIIWFVISIILMGIIVFIDYETLSRFSPFIYGLSIILLIAVLFTKSINGASSWFNIGFFSFQPAEISKISVILFTAYIMAKMQEKNRDEINIFWKLGLVVLIVVFPVFLIIIEPDFGTAAAYLVALVLMLFVSGINRKYIITAILLVAISIPLIYLFVLPDHAKKRIDVFLNPESDPKGSRV